VQRHRPRLVFDLAETTLVDLAAVRFLAAHEGDGVELLRCPRYIREWIARSKPHSGAELMKNDLENGTEVPAPLISRRTFMLAAAATGGAK